MTARILILISGDDASKKLAAEFLKDFERKSYLLVEDHTMSVDKIWRLLKKRRIGFLWLIRQYFSSKRQQNALSKHSEISPDLCINSHKEFSDYIALHPNLDMLFAFRAGLVLQKSLLSKIKCINTHYARLPEYGGLGAISKALKNKDYDQQATIHQMTSEIDKGEIYLTHDYTLDSGEPYWKNELKAAYAGVEVARCYLKKHFETQQQPLKNTGS